MSDDRIYQNSGPESLDVTLPADAPVMRPDDIDLPGGLSLAELREASIDVMLEPYRRRLHEIEDVILAAISEALSIVRDLASDDDPYIEGDIFQGAFCRYCDAAKRMDHERSCEWRRAVEYVAAHPTDEGDT